MKSIWVNYTPSYRVPRLALYHLHSEISGNVLAYPIQLTSLSFRARLPGTGTFSPSTHFITRKRDLGVASGRTVARFGSSSFPLR